MARGMAAVCCMLALAIACPVANAAEPEKVKPKAPDQETGRVTDLGEIVVTPANEGRATHGYRYSRGDLGPLGNLSLKDMPYSFHVTSGELIENRNAHNPTDALRTNATVAPLMSSGGYSTMHRVMVRGFSASDQGDLRDGMTDRSFSLPPLADVERVEVVNGLTSFLYGFAAVGGTVNYVAKRPLDEPLVAVRTGSYNKGILFGHADLGGPIYGDRLTYRLNVYGEDGDAYIHDSEQERGLVSGALQYRVGESTYLKTNFYHQDMSAEGLQTYFDIRGVNYRMPAPFDPTKQYGQKWTYNKATKTVGDLGIMSELSEVFSLRAAVRGATMDREYCFVGARLTDLAGNYTETYVDSSGNDETATAAYVLMDADFDTWDVNHKVTFGYTHWGFMFERGTNVVTPLGPSNVDARVPYSRPIGASGDDRRMKMKTHNFLVGDRIELHPALSVLAGVNYTKLDADYHGLYAVPPRPSRVTQEELTPTCGLVLKPVPAVALYASYMEGLEQGRTAPAGAQNANDVLDPSVSKQYEAGLKTTVWETLDLTAAVFQIRKVNHLLDPMDNVYRQDGLQKHQGVELTASGQLFDHLTLTGGWNLMSAKIADASNNPALEGETPVNVPARQARLYLEYQLPAIPKVPGLFTISAGAYYYGRRPVNIPNSKHIDSVVTFDVGLRYQLKDNLTINLGVSNLRDEHYWSYYRSGSDGAGEDGLLLGDPRLVTFSLKYVF